MNALSKLENIETVMLDILMTTSSEVYLPTCLRFSSDKSSKEQCLAVAEAFMASCTTLRRFSFSALGSSVGAGRIYPCFVRRPGGKVQLEGFDLIGKDSWRDGV